ncbi:Membrane proteinase PrsW, cleaves anti-sigma factor RsiW, M82 family [Virgibacillus subterraneus]|uniref:Protease PrsW n=2 Tax=Virgibacillus TaxID=84406 RepID=A0A1H1BQ02_9BACI|nr:MULTISPECIES: glutamic-type intramembrane protease PrsW [Virgibacillus]SDQ53998.1 Membrane proteinase PrsW, cleaves anti-sigma factor RsiW, M82 family [Virgibacillus salinus]SEQ25167.1 Membrane proteinase PrsW, cleaves anti-sigma factor RsiW, M82 family [Virgibacillus subterraneus]
MLAILSAGIAPTFALMSFIYLKDRFTEPFSLILKTFILGALLVFPIMFIQYALTIENIVNDNNFIQSFLVVGFIEEFFKWFIFMYVIYHHTEFDAHYDGIVYAVSISLGFATVENFLYLLTNGIEYAFSRALFPVSSHALFGVIMGFHFGKAKINSNYKKWNILLALIIPLTLHGSYNYILKSITSNWLTLLVPFMIGLWIIGLRRVKSANKPIIEDVIQKRKLRA